MGRESMADRNCRANESSVILVMLWGKKRIRVDSDVIQSKELL